MKKTLVLFAAVLCMAIAFTACGSSATGDAPAEETTEAATAA